MKNTCLAALGGVTAALSAVSAQAGIARTIDFGVTSSLGAEDDSGLRFAATVSISATASIDMPLSFPRSPKAWADSAGAFMETLNSADSTAHAVGADFPGSISSSGFVNAPAFRIFFADQAQGAAKSVTETARSAVPEPAPWVMILCGFVGLGYAGMRSRRGRRGRRLEPSL